MRGSYLREKRRRVKPHIYPMPWPQGTMIWAALGLRGRHVVDMAKDFYDLCAKVERRYRKKRPPQFVAPDEVELPADRIPFALFYGDFYKLKFTLAEGREVEQEYWCLNSFIEDVSKRKIYILRKAK